ncbi:MAG TPA: replication-relaxation family protein [Ktedonobacteraceae bacterium]|nr:replication-relaxation family protein [Ktedonobacteraceae bacterium]
MVRMPTDAPFVITPAYDVLLRGSQDMPIGLYHLHLASAEQLCRLHYSMGSVKAVRAKLRKLCDHKYVQFDATPTKRLRSPYYYALDKLGFEYLQAAGLDVPKSFRSAKEVDKAYLFAKHTLELNNIIISAALLKRSNPNYWLESFIHERELKHRPYKVSWSAGGFSLIPDAFLTFCMIVPDGRQRRVPIVIEHDRGSEEQHYFRRRIRAYLMMLRNEGYKELFGVGGITIAFTTSASVERLKKMREWTAKELEETGETQYRNLFYFTLLQNTIDPYQVWINTTWLPVSENKPVSLLAGVP